MLLAVLRSRAAEVFQCLVVPSAVDAVQQALSNPRLYSAGPAAAKGAASGRGSEGELQTGTAPVRHKLWMAVRSQELC